MLLAMALKHSRKIGEIFAVRLAESDGFGDAIALTLEIRLVHVAQIDEIHRGTSHNDQRLKIVHANDVAKVIKIISRSNAKGIPLLIVAILAL